MSIERKGEVFFVVDFGVMPEKSTAVVVQQAMKSRIAMANFMRLVEFEKPKS
jgi:hypothetical protein